MFVSGSMICLQSDKRVQVDDLCVGDRLVDPLTGGLGTLVDIRWRDVAFSVGGVSIFTELRPIRISVGALRDGVPERPLLVSPEQPILLPNPLRQGNGTPVLELQSCQSLLGLPGISLASDVDTCRYFALFFKQHQFVDVEGAVFQGVYADIETRAAPVRRTDISGSHVARKKARKTEGSR